MPISADLQSLSHDAEIDLFELSGYNRQSLGEKFYFANGTGISFGGIQYLPISCAITGIEYTGEGSLPRPTLAVSDAGRILSGLIYFYEGIEGSTLTLRKTLAKYLDGGSSPDSSAIKTFEIWQVSQCTKEIPGQVIEFELSNPLDFVDETLPSRVAMRLCPWVYRGSDCGYTGTQGYTLDNKRTLNPKKDRCAKTVTACALRFGRNNVLNHGGYPSLSRSG